MEKGAETTHGTFVGERLVERERPLQSDEKVPSSYPDPGEGNPDIFRTHQIVYVFDKDGTEVEVPLEESL